MHPFLCHLYLLSLQILFFSFCSCEIITNDLFAPNYVLEEGKVNAYLTNVDYTEDSDYTQSLVEVYLETPVVDMSRPKPVKLAWKTDTPTEGYEIVLSSDSLFSNPWTYNTDGSKNSIEVYNLIPNTQYYWKVTAVSGSNKSIVNKGMFFTCGHRRFLYIPGDNVGNFRDLGGLSCGNSEYIKYGKLIRGAEVLRVDGGPYIKISDDGISELRDRIGCTVELDFGDLYDDSPLEGEGFEVFRDHDIFGFYGYDRSDRGLRTIKGRECLHNCLELVINKLKEGKSVYFHCNAGADRTGTFAFIIESLCGVSDNDKSKDYELTSFYADFYSESQNYTQYVIRKRNAPLNGYSYKTMVAYIMERFDGVSLNNKVYNMCTAQIDEGGIGLSVEQINSLRSVLLFSM